MDKMPTNYGPPRVAMATRIPHPEMCDDKDANCDGPMTATATALANETCGQLADARERTDRILARLHGPQPGECKDPTKPAGGLMHVLSENVTAGAALLRMLDQIENCIGG